MRYIYDAKRKLHIYDAKIKGAVRVGDYSVVPDTLKNVQILSRMGLPVRDPLADYGFPGPYRHIPQQRDMTTFMVLNPRCFNLSDPRTGKTVSTLHATDFIMRERARLKKPASTLILATKSTLFDPWAKHVREMFAGKRTCRVLTGSAKTRCRDFRIPADYYISNFDGLKLIAANELPEHIGIVVIDEFTAYKHANTRRFKQANTCFKNIEHLIVLSGTPTPERSVDAYGPAKLVHGLNDESYDSFKNRCMVHISNFRWVERAEAPAIAARALQPAIRFTREQVIGLPNKLPLRRVDVELSPEQHAMAERLREQTLDELDGKVITAVNAAAIRSKFLQIYQGIIYDDAKNTHFLNPAPRLQAMKEIVDEVGGRLLIFASFSGAIKMLLKELAEYNPRHISGEVSAKTRLHVMSDFNAGNVGPLICDPGAAGHGLDLTGAATTVWWGPTDRNEHYTQANERIEGIKQKLPTQIIQLCSSKLEREVYRRLEEKQAMQMDILELVA